MKCENCGGELIGGAIICTRCKHNNARQRVKEWREKRNILFDRSSKPSAPIVNRPVYDETPETSPPIEASNSDANLLRFPSATRSSRAGQPHVITELPVDEEPALSEYPAWRTQVKERVRQAREKRQSQIPIDDERPDEVLLDPNPIVAAALKRIRRPATAPSVSAVPATMRNPLAASRNSALAKALDPEPEPIIEIDDAPPVVTPPRVERAPVQNATPRPAIGRIESKPLTARTTPLPTAKPEQKSPQLPTSTTAKTGPAGPSGITERTMPLPAKPRQDAPSQRETRETQVKTASYPNLAPPEISPIVKETGKSVETQIIDIPFMAQELPGIYSRPATLWMRTLAGACDFEIIAMAFLPIFAAYATLNASLGREIFIIMVILLAATTFVYQAVTLSLADRTFGMALLNLRLVNTDDETLPITRRQIFMRAWAATIAFLCPPLNLLVSRLNRFHRSLPDLISGTSPVEQ